MATIVYLDTDDEITSAAARMRAAAEGRVALVVPYGSRLATSRINFRLLAREAQTRGRQLGIVAPDGATRALAASAGLPVFSSVGEYEAAVDTAPTKADPVPPAAGSSNDAAAPEASAEAPRPARKRAAARDDLEQTTAIVTPVASATASDEAFARPAPATGSGRTASIPVAQPSGRRFGRPLLVLGIGALALALLVGGVAGYVFLPSAQITLTPRLASVGPIVVEVRADPAATSVDVENAVVPARRVTFDLEAADTFPATGRRVEETRASGRVTFRSKDPTEENTIASGAVVATPNGVRFRTTEAVEVPRATIVGLQLVPGQASVRVEAVEPGPAGNVDANTITVIPQGEDPIFTDVRNTEPTAGGSRREFPRIVQADVDGAVQQLTTAIGRQFAERLADRASVPNGMTLFPETQTLGDPAMPVDPATLVGKEMDAFELSMSAQGAVIAVDESPLEQIAQANIRGAVDEEHTLVESSIEVTFGEPTVDGQQVIFPATARARQAPLLDREALLAEVMGRSIAQARSILEPYGAVDVRVWPEWVTAIPTIDSRVSLTIAPPRDPQASATPRASGSPGPSGPAAPGSAAPGSAVPSVSPAAPGG